MSYQKMSSPIMDKILERVNAVIEELQKEDNNISAKVSIDKDANIIKIYGVGSDYIKRASSGLSEILELAYTTAEHHPYWLLLYHATEICKMTLDAWKSELNRDQLSEISWRCDEIKMAIEKLMPER
jgi:hypothetical protein